MTKLALIGLIAAAALFAAACNTHNNGGPLPDGNLEPDTLYAQATVATAAVGAEVTVVVYTGVPAHPFEFMNGCGLTMEADAEKVAGSFNTGVPGGQPDASDGFWAAMDPADGFLLAPDNFILATDIGGGRERWDFNVTPIGGSDVTASEGALFNYKFTFGTAGVKTFGFQEFSGVNRTYYSDSTSTQYFWGDSTNVSAPSVTVN
jgi:hypothetical protein